MIEGREEEIRQQAEEIRAWLRAYIEVGFSWEEGMRLLTRPIVVVNSLYPPEMAEWFTKMNLSMDKEL